MITCPCQSIFSYTFFASDFSTPRKVGAGLAIVCGVALAIIFALAIGGIISGINAQLPIICFVFGIVFFLGGGLALAGCRPRDPLAEIGESLSKLKA